MIVSANFSLSDITNKEKKVIAKTKQITLITPISISPLINESNAISSGTKRNSVNPITEPTPCILDDVVDSLFVLFTLKNAVKIQAPTANTVIIIISTIVIHTETDR